MTSTEMVQILPQISVSVTQAFHEKMSQLTTERPAAQHEKLQALDFLRLQIGHEPPLHQLDVEVHRACCNRGRIQPLTAVDEGCYTEGSV